VGGPDSARRSDCPTLDESSGLTAPFGRDAGACHFGGVHKAIVPQRACRSTRPGDGNPIFTTVCPGRRLGVRVIQYSPESPHEVDLDWWVDSFGDEKSPDSIRELVISCVLSAQTARWLSGSCTTG